MIVVAWLVLALVAIAAWADLHTLYREHHRHQVSTDRRVAELGRQVQDLRRRNLRLIDRPVVRWHDDLEGRIRAYNSN
jgi:type II secretory pathway component PulJ